MDIDNDLNFLVNKYAKWFIEEQTEDIVKKNLQDLSFPMVNRDFISPRDIVFLVSANNLYLRPGTKFHGECQFKTIIRVSGDRPTNNIHFLYYIAQFYPGLDLDFLDLANYINQEDMRIHRGEFLIKIKIALGNNKNLSDSLKLWIEMQ